MAQTWFARARDTVLGAGRVFDRTPKVAAAPAKAPKASSFEKEPLVYDLPLYQSLQRIGGSLTPGLVASIIREADNGRMYRLVDLTNELRQKDLHLQGILETFETDVSGMEWQISPPEGATAKEVEAADFLDKQLRAIDEMPDLFAHLAGGFLNSHAVAENIFETDGRQIVCTGFRLPSPRRFCYELTQGRLQWWDQSGGKGPAASYPGVDFMAEWPGRFIAFTPRVVGDVQCREGLARPLMWAALFRNWDLRDWLSLAELAWKPWRIAEMSKLADEEDQNSIMSALQAMTASRIGVFPEGTNVKVEWPKNLGPGGSPHSELFDVMGREMSKGVLGTTTTVELGKHGNQSASQTGARVEKKKLGARARKISGGIRAHLLTPLTRMNYGADVRVPVFRFSAEDEIDMLNFSQGVKTLVEAGVKSIPAKWVHDEVGIPIPKVAGDAEDEDAVDYTLEAPQKPAPGGDDSGDGKKPSAGNPGAADKKPKPKPKPGGGAAEE